MPPWPVSGGAPEHPQWYWNLRRRPELDLQDGTVVTRRRARELEGEERAAWWERCVATFPPYASYERKTDRLIPVFVLEPCLTSDVWRLTSGGSASRSPRPRRGAR